MPRIADPPRRIFTVRPTKIDPPRLPTAANQWGTMTRLPVEVRDMISAYVGDFPAGVAALNSAGLTQNPLDPRSHNNLTLALWQYPCTEKSHPPGAVFNGAQLPGPSIPCPNNRKGAGLPYQGRIRNCQGHGNLGLSCCGTVGQTPHDIAYICEDHFRGTKTWWQLHDRANFDKCHKVPPCRYHETQLMRQYPEGVNTCTCNNVDLESWQCAQCFDWKVRRMGVNFFARVELPYRGDADMSILRPAVAPGENPNIYWSDWRVVREMLARQHPCMHFPVSGCTFKRLGGIHRKRVLDCRCCGGIIVQPQGNLKVTRADRGKDQDIEFYELDDRGKAKKQRIQ
ncbi:MAG: hypothetical protein Q9191_002510 [Dirinaria sp. TL-2023a]